VLTRYLGCLAAAALAAGGASAQINITIGGGRHPIPPYLGTVGRYRPVAPIYRPPAVGVVRPYPGFRPVAPVVSLRPTIYPGAYVSQFTPGYQTILAGNTSYYYYPTLPVGAAAVTVGGLGYYRAGGVWYRPYATAGRNVFLVVPPPL
jgi:hypothetical protein